MLFGWTDELFNRHFLSSQVSQITLITDLQVRLFHRLLVRPTSLTLSLPPVLPLFSLWQTSRLRKSSKNQKNNWPVLEAGIYLRECSKCGGLKSNKEQRGQQRKNTQLPHVFLSFLLCLLSRALNSTIRRISGKTGLVFSILWSLSFETEVGIIFSYFVVRVSLLKSCVCINADLSLHRLISSKTDWDRDDTRRATPPSCPAPTSCFKIHQIMGTSLKMQNHCGWSLTDKRVILRPASPHNMTCHASLFVPP